MKHIEERDSVLFFFVFCRGGASRWKSATKAIVVSIVISVISGCASSPQTTPIANTEERIVFNGFSILPPNGTGWKWVGSEPDNPSRNPNSEFVKQDGDRTYIARAHTVDTGQEDFSDPGRLLDHIKSSDLMKENPRQRNLESDIRIDHSLHVPCVRYDLEAEDSKPPGRPGVIFDLDVHGFYCDHPKASRALIWIFYTRRTPKGQPYVAGLGEGERFLNSLQFEAVYR